MSSITFEEKMCLFCKKPVKGRSDKKFCDDYCRNNYNNAQKGDTVNLIRNINNALRKNRNILASYLSGKSENIKVPRDKLLTAGFQFKYCTHQYQTRIGHVYLFCYDYGYLPLEHNWLLIVRAKTL